MSAAKAALWQQVSQLLAEYERAQLDTVRAAIQRNYEELRTKLQILALTDEPANDDTNGER